MTDQKLIDDVCELTQLDIDAEAAYKQALDNIDNKEIYQRIKEFADDHAEHINKLSSWIISNRGTAPERKKDIKGYFIEGFTAIASKIGLTPTLKALQQNERLTNKKYKDALDLEGDDVLKNIIKQGYEDEVKHLRYINEQLNKV